MVEAHAAPSLADISEWPWSHRLKLNLDKLSSCSSKGRGPITKTYLSLLTTLQWFQLSSKEKDLSLPICQVIDWSLDQVNIAMLFALKTSEQSHV